VTSIICPALVMGVNSSDYTKVRRCSLTTGAYTRQIFGLTWAIFVGSVEYFQ